MWGAAASAQIGHPAEGRHTVTILETELSAVHGDRDELATEVHKLCAELQRTRNETSVLRVVSEASKRSRSIVLSSRTYRRTSNPPRAR